jgi:hypothetical protein
MIWQFSLVDINNIAVVVDEPVGWDGIACNFTRNLTHHGIFTNVTTNSFEWVEDAYDLLLAEYQMNGANGSMDLLIEYQCAEGDTLTTYFRGKFDFNTFERQCLDYCFIKCDVTATKCTDIFLSRMGQDVNVQSTQNFDGDAIAPMTFTTLNIEGQDIFVQNKADNDNGDNFAGLTLDSSNTTGTRYYDIPILLPNNPIIEFGDWNVNNVSPSIVAKNEGIDNISFPMSGSDFSQYFNFIYLYQPAVDDCVSNIDYTWRTKGNFNITPNYNGFIEITLRAIQVNPLTGPAISLGTVIIATGVALTNGVQTTIAFDETNSSSFTNGTPFDFVAFYFHLEILKTSASALDQNVISIDYDSGSVNYFNMEANSACGETTTDSVSLPDLLEWLPTAYYSSECPQLQIENELRDCLARYSITKGSFLRNVIEPSVPQLFTSFEFMFDNCRKIFNIGWGFDNNETELLIGNINDFYLGSVVADVGLVNKATFTTAKDLIYGTITIGYNKWEAEEYNGLDEMNTERQYRRNINSNPSELDLMADIISAGYTIEVTRRKNQAETGTSDWRYDDDLFIINTFEDEGQLYAYRGVDLSPAFVYSPATRMNFTLTPVRNLMRWFRTLAAPTPTVTNESLKFTSGTGNFRAGGQMTTSCPVEDQQIFENSIINSTLFQSGYINPIWKTIYATFEAPLSMVQFEAIKTNVYGAIRFRCGNDLYLGNIVTLSHEPNTGLASFKLLLRR